MNTAYMGRFEVAARHVHALIYASSPLGLIKLIIVKDV